MAFRTAICVALILLIALVSFAPVWVGHGPFSSVYGPATTFRAYRAALQLQSALAAILLVLFNFAALGSLLLESRALAAARDANISPLSVSAILRC
jgi:hypothetical protein